MLNIKIVKKIIRVSVALAMFAGVVSCVGAKNIASSKSESSTADATVAKKDAKNQGLDKKGQTLGFNGSDELVISLSEKSDAKVYGPTARIIQLALADSIAEKFKEFLETNNKDLGVSAEDIKKLDISSLISFEKMPDGDVSLNDACKAKFSLKKFGIYGKTKKVLGLALVGLLDALKKSGYFDKNGNLFLNKILNSVKFKNNLHKKLKIYSEKVKEEYGDKKESKVDDKKLTEKEVDRVIGLTKNLTLTIGGGVLGNGKKEKVNVPKKEMSNLQKVLNGEE